MERYGADRISGCGLCRGRWSDTGTWMCRKRNYHGTGKIKRDGAYEVYQPDVVLYDVLGDVVCGGFSMPMRKGYADKVFIITSGENMAIHAGANIAMAVENFKNRGYASLGGIILNRRNVAREEEKVQELADDFQTQVVGTLSHSGLVTEAEEEEKRLWNAFRTVRWLRNTENLRKQSMSCQNVTRRMSLLKRVGQYTG